MIQSGIQAFFTGAKANYKIGTPANGPWVNACVVDVIKYRDDMADIWFCANCDKSDWWEISFRDESREGTCCSCRLIPLTPDETGMEGTTENIKEKKTIKITFKPITGEYYAKIN